MNYLQRCYHLYHTEFYSRINLFQQVPQTRVSSTPYSKENHVSMTSIIYLKEKGNVIHEKKENEQGMNIVLEVEIQRQR